MTFKKECKKIAKELKPYWVFLIKDIILIASTVVALKIVIFIIEKAYGHATTLVGLLESTSQIGIFVMFLIHTAAGLLELAKKTWKKSKK